MGFWASLNGFNPDATNGPPSPGNASEDQRRDYLALYYEWLTEQGFAEQIGQHIIPHLVYPPRTLQDFFDEEDPVPLPDYDSSVTQAAITFATEQATDLVMIYGAWDPWTGGQLAAPTGERTGKFTAPTAGHWASVGELPELDQTAALALLGEMFDQVPNITTKSRRSAKTAEHTRRRATMRRLRARHLRFIERRLRRKYAQQLPW